MKFRPSFASPFSASPFSTRRNPSRRRSSGGSSGGLFGSLKGEAKKLVSKDTLMLVAGATAANFATGYLVRNYGSKLPGVVGSDGKTNPLVVTAYSVGIPLIVAVLLRKTKQPALAQGAFVAAAFAAGTFAISQVTSKTGTGMGAYITPAGGLRTSDRSKGLAAYSAARNLPQLAVARSAAWGQPFGA